MSSRPTASRPSSIALITIVSLLIFYFQDSIRCIGGEKRREPKGSTWYWCLFLVLPGGVVGVICVAIISIFLVPISLGAVHKWRHHFWGVSRPPPPFPLVIMSSFGYPIPAPFWTHKWWEKLAIDKTGYARLLMIIYSAQQLFLCLGLIWPLFNGLKCFFLN